MQIDELGLAKATLKNAGSKYVQNLRPGEAAMLVESDHGHDILATFIAGAVNTLTPTDDNWHLPRATGHRAVKLIGYGEAGETLTGFVMQSAERAGVAEYFSAVEVIGIGWPDNTAAARDLIVDLIEPGDFVAIAAAHIIVDEPADAARWIAGTAKLKGAIIVAQTSAESIVNRPDNLRVFRMERDKSIWAFDRQLTIPRRVRKAGGTRH
ncbi:MAG: hypothetical protein VR78_10995 [Hoeflea sp. BRH_c9]|nr:MAG: hypothetical protein VR78_10995 [Hoeflea sp. BRH_c9]